MKTPLHRLARRLTGDSSGAAAVELALITPFLGAILLAMYAGWDAAARVQDMRDGLESGARYYLNGGLDDSVARSAILDAWRNRPEETSIEVTRACRCGGESHDCAILCSDDTPPAVYVTMTASSTDPSAIAASELVESQVVRVR